MKQMKWILSLIVAVVLAAVALVLGFASGVESGVTNVYTAEINEKFNVKDVEALMKDAGAKSVLVENSLVADADGNPVPGTYAVIYFAPEKGKTAEDVFAEAEKLLGAKYFLKYTGKLATLNSYVNVPSFVKLWPALIVLALVLVYAFLRFNVRGGLSVLLMTVTVLLASAGLIGVTRTAVTNYAAAAVIGATILADLFALAFLLVLKNNARKMERGAFEATQKQIGLFACAAAVLAVLAAVMMMIFGNAMLGNFAVSALLGTVVALAAVLVTLPSLVQAFGKAK